MAQTFRIETTAYVDGFDWNLSATCEPDDVQDICIVVDETNETIDFDGLDIVTRDYVMDCISRELHRAVAEHAADAADRRSDFDRDERYLAHVARGY